MAGLHISESEPLLSSLQNTASTHQGAWQKGKGRVYQSEETQGGDVAGGFQNNTDYRPIFAFQLKDVSLCLENSGSVARDHLASERTFLAYMRTSLAIAASGVGGCNLSARSTCVIIIYLAMLSKQHYSSYSPPRLSEICMLLHSSSIYTFVHSDLGL